MRKKIEFWKIRRVIRGLAVPDSYRLCPPADFLLIAPDEARTEKTIAGLEFSRLIDPIAIELENLGFSVSHLNRSPSILRTNETFYKTFTYNRAHFFRVALSFFFPRKLGLQLRVSWARRLILFSRPNLVFTWEGQAEIRLAAKSLGIPCVEVIHGVGYSQNGQVAWLTGSEGVWPSDAICFDEITASILRTSAPPQQLNIYLTENFWLATFSKRAASLSPGHEPRERLFPALQAREKFDYRILITLSWGEDPYSPDSPLSKVWDLIREKNQEAFWRIRFHPVQLSSTRSVDRRTVRQTKRLFSGLDHVDIDECQRVPLPLIAQDSTHHITSESMSSFEMAFFGVPSLILGANSAPTNQNGRHVQFSELESGGYASLGRKSKEEISDWILNATKLEPREDSQNHSTLKLVLKQILASAEMTQGGLDKNGSH